MKERNEVLVDEPKERKVNLGRWIPSIMSIGVGVSLIVYAQFADTTEDRTAAGVAGVGFAALGTVGLIDRSLSRGE